MVKLDLVKMKCLATSKSITVRCTVEGKTNKQIGKDIRSAQRKIVTNAREKFGDQVKVNFKINENSESNSVNFKVDAKEVEVEGGT